MQTGNVTTPFGRRPAVLALVKRQLQTSDTKPYRPVEKWKVFRDACEARERLGLQDRALAVLDALLTFYPHLFPSTVRPAPAILDDQSLELDRSP